MKSIDHDNHRDGFQPNDGSDSVTCWNIRKKYAGFVHLLQRTQEKGVCMVRDEYGIIAVYDVNDRRYLGFGSGYIQSCQLKSTPAFLLHHYHRAMLLALLFHKPQHVTLFGLGGGCLAQTLYHHLKDTRIRAVELRERVVDIAFRYFQLPADQRRLAITRMDAREYLSQAATQSTDIIFSDMYHAQRCDPLQLEGEFIAQCHRLLTDKGWLVLNYINSAYLDLNWREAILYWFADVRVCVVPNGNWIVLASKQPISLSSRELHQRAKMYSKQFGFSFNRHLRQLVCY